MSDITYNHLYEIDKNFTRTPNELATDPNLSFGAKVVFLYMIGKPTGWVFWTKEIQKSLGIKDSQTISKYMKELIKAGWMDRTRTKKDDGQFSGGYTYILRPAPYVDKTHIREKAVHGCSPAHSNTDLDNKTNLLINTNSNSINISENENLNNDITIDKSNSTIDNKLDNTIDNKPNGKLLNIEVNNKNKSIQSYIELINSTFNDSDVRKEIYDYFNNIQLEDTKKGKRPKKKLSQWKIILDEFKKECVGKSKQEIIGAIRNSHKVGWMGIYFSTQTNTNQNYTKRVTTSRSVENEEQYQISIDNDVEF